MSRWRLGRHDYAGYQGADSKPRLMETRLKKMRFPITGTPNFAL